MGEFQDWLIDDMYAPIAPVGSLPFVARSHASAKQV